MEYRRLGRLEHQSSVLIYGAASLGGVDQDTADASVAEALAAGINHFDVAASYGDAELRLGPMMGDLRDKIFLATKTGERAEDAAWAQINASLERLQTDHLDLIQMHGVCDMENLDLVTGPKGSLQAAIRAKDEGLVSAIGLTGHAHQAPTVQLEGLRRFPFDSILTPLNHRLFQEPGYRESFEALVAAVKEADAALMTIKMIAKRPWPGTERPYQHLVRAVRRAAAHHRRHYLAAQRPPRGDRARDRRRDETARQGDPGREGPCEHDRR